MASNEAVTLAVLAEHIRMEKEHLATLLQSPATRDAELLNSIHRLQALLETKLYVQNVVSGKEE